MERSFVRLSDSFFNPVQEFEIPAQTQPAVESGVAKRQTRKRKEDSGQNFSESRESEESNESEEHEEPEDLDNPEKREIVTRWGQLLTLETLQNMSMEMSYLEAARSLRTTPVILNMYCHYLGMKKWDQKLSKEEATSQERAAAETTAESVTTRHGTVVTREYLKDLERRFTLLEAAEHLEISEFLLRKIYKSLGMTSWNHLKNRVRQRKNSRTSTSEQDGSARTDSTNSSLSPAPFSLSP